MHAELETVESAGLPWGVKLFIVFMVLVLVLALSVRNYRDSYQTRERYGHIPNTGDHGRIVSWYPYDVKVTLNVPATKHTENGEEPARKWITVWRWQVAFDDGELK